MEIEYRYELKYQINKQVAENLKKQLSLVMNLDANSVSSEYSYKIRSLYFDDIYNSAYYEKVDGVEIRKKYRIRIYNNSDQIVKLECKHKDGNMTYKEAMTIDKETAINLINRDYSKIVYRKGLLNKFIVESNLKLLKPCVIVDYERLAYTYNVSEVRITFDYNLRSGRNSTDLFNPNIVTYPVLDDDQCILEVKCNEFIPGHILNILNSYPMIRMAISKFELCDNVK